MASIAALPLMAVADAKWIEPTWIKVRRLRLGPERPKHRLVHITDYDLGLFPTPAGPLYVNPGLGWFPVPIRLNCRPEITVFET